MHKKLCITEYGRITNQRKMLLKCLQKMIDLHNPPQRNQEAKLVPSAQGFLFSLSPKKAKIIRFAFSFRFSMFICYYHGFFLSLTTPSLHLHISESNPLLSLMPLKSLFFKFLVSQAKFDPHSETQVGKNLTSTGKTTG